MLTSTALNMCLNLTSGWGKAMQNGIRCREEYVTTGVGGIYPIVWYLIEECYLGQDVIYARDGV